MNNKDCDGQQLISQLPIGLALCRMDGQLVEINPAYAAIIGRSVEETLSLSYREITPKDYEAQDKQQLASLQRNGRYGPYEKEYLHAHGHRVAVRLSSQLIERNGEHYIWSNVEDITDFKLAKQALHDSETRLNNFFEATFESILIHAHGIILDTNPALDHMLGYTTDEIVGRHLLDFIPQSLQNVLQYNMDVRNNGPYEATLLAKDGNPIPVEVRAKSIKHQGKDARVIGFRDISERKQAETQLSHLAHHDPLTGLPNRLNFNKSLGHAINVAGQQNRKMALMFLDLDRFKYINDTLGHDTGDQLLQIIAERLKNSIREQDTVARLGGDEFTIILQNIDARDDAESVAKKLIKVVRQPVVIGEHKLDISTSLGISLYPDDASDHTNLVKAADTAMYHAKAAGKNGYQFFTVELAARMLEQALIRMDMNSAIDNNEFELHYQPQVSLKDNHVTGVEALIRWNHPQSGLLPPKTFLSIADELDLIDELTAWTLRTAYRDYNEWTIKTPHHLRLSINVTGGQLIRENSVRKIISVLDELHEQYQPIPLELEVVEGEVTDTEHAIAMVKHLNNHGINVALDDFGTGYSSLSRLKHLPVNTLKIDRSFIHDIAQSEEDSAITNAIVSIAHSLNLRIVAEGVETKSQLEKLRELGCNEVQGFYYREPVPSHLLSHRHRKNPPSQRPLPAIAQTMNSKASSYTNSRAQSRVNINTNNEASAL